MIRMLRKPCLETEGGRLGREEVLEGDTEWPVPTTLSIMHKKETSSPFRAGR